MAKAKKKSTKSRRGLRGTEAEHKSEAERLMAFARKSLRLGTCGSVNAALTAAVEAHAHSQYVTSSGMDWYAWKLETAARDKLHKLSCASVQRTPPGAPERTRHAPAPRSRYVRTMRPQKGTPR